MLPDIRDRGLLGSGVGGIENAVVHQRPPPICISRPSTRAASTTSDEDDELRPEVVTRLRHYSKRTIGGLYLTGGGGRTGSTSPASSWRPSPTGQLGRWGGRQGLDLMG